MELAFDAADMMLFTADGRRIDRTRAASRAA